MTKIIMIGGSHAAIATAAKLRVLDPEAEISIISSDEALPYQRPPLSKAYMAGKASFEQILLRPESWYEENRITLYRGEFAAAIDRQGKTVTLSGGKLLDYDFLVLATGARARRLPEEIGGHLDNVYTMRDIGDADQLKVEIVADRNLVVIGGGYIGLEAASEARKKGVNVTVLEGADRILKRVACVQTANDVRALHQSHGVVVRENVKISFIAEGGAAGEKGRAIGVQLDDGSFLPADFIVTGIGVTPDTALAANCGLAVDNGITVDMYLKTEDGCIFAAGDCAAFPFKGSMIRLESVQNAHDQGALIAANITGETLSYAPVPWFWSDQYDLKLQIAGLHTGYDSVLTRKGAREGSHSHFYFAGERFLAADCLNDGATYMLARRILESGKILTKAQVMDPEFVMKSLLG